MEEALAELASATEQGVVIVLLGKITTNNAQAFEQTIFRLREQHPQGTLTIDADALEYTSSAGLRVFMKLLKREGDLAIVNVSPEVYDVFQTTGFTQLMTVRKRLREVSLEGATMLGRGGNGEVWRLDAETVIKVYNEGTSLQKIEAENKHATAAFTTGLPCAIAFDTVRVGSRYGIVFELLDAQTVGAAVNADPSRIPELGRKMGELLREMHGTHMTADVLPTIEDKMGVWIDYLEERYLSHDDAELMRQVVAAIPKADTLLHLDFHEGNVMIQGDELILIDLDDICVGNPLYDLMNHYSSHVIATAQTPEVVRHTMSMEVSEALAMYNQTLKTYYNTDDSTVIDKHMQTMQLLMLFVLMLFPAKSRDSKNLTPERAQGVLDQILPQFRAMQPQIVAVASNWK